MHLNVLHFIIVRWIAINLWDVYNSTNNNTTSAAMHSSLMHASYWITLAQRHAEKEISLTWLMPLLAFGRHGTARYILFIYMCIIARAYWPISWLIQSTAYFEVKFGWICILFDAYFCDISNGNSCFHIVNRSCTVRTLRLCIRRWWRWWRRRRQQQQH